MQCQNCDIILGRTDFEGHRRECKKAQVPDDGQLRSLVSDKDKDAAVKELVVVQLELDREKIRCKKMVEELASSEDKVADLQRVLNDMYKHQ